MTVICKISKNSPALIQSLVDIVIQFSSFNDIASFFSIIHDFFHNQEHIYLLPPIVIMIAEVGIHILFEQLISATRQL